MNLLSIEHLVKNFGGKVAVKDVSIAVEAGKVYALIGPNGSGKTTLVKTIAGLLRPTEGTILINCVSVAADPALTKSKIGYVPDEPSVWPGMTGEEFLHFMGALFNVPENDRKTRIASLLSRFNLAGIEQGYFEDYSRGNKQKFTIMAALIHEPKLLLVDEPIVGLDPQSAEIAKEEFKNFAKRGGAAFIVTHTLPVAQEIADTIGVLKSGTLVAEGSMNDLRTKAKLDGNADLGAVYKALAQ